MTSCPRDPFTYGDSIKSAADAGFVLDWCHLDLKKELGSYDCFRECLKILVTKPNIDAVLIFQDDIEVSKNLSQLKLPPEVWNKKTGIVSLYTAGPQQPEIPGWSKLPQTENSEPLYGALAVLMPKNVAVDFSMNPPNPAAMTMTDFWLSQYCKAKELDIWIHSPSFVRHTGVVSAIESTWPADWPARNCKDFCLEINT